MALFSLFITCADPATDPGAVRGTDDAAPPEAGAPSVIQRNDGQISDPDILYVFTTRGYRAAFGADGVTLQIFGPSREPGGTQGTGGLVGSASTGAEEEMTSFVLGLTFEGANPTLPVGREAAEHPTHFLVGADRDGWVRDVPSFREVVYENIYDGIDLVYRATVNGLKYEFVVRPGADPDEITLVYEGIEGLDVRPDGSLVLDTAMGDLSDGVPVSYGRVPGRDYDPEPGSAALPQESVFGTSYELKGSDRYGFEVTGWDGRDELVIDPFLHASYLGGAFNEYVRSVAVDGSGFVYLTGWTTSGDFPTTAGSYDPVYSGSTEAFIIKFHRKKSMILYATYIGGSGQDDAYAIDVDGARHPWIAGNTASSDFPVTDGSTHSGGRYDVFVARLLDDGSDLVSARYVGGSNEDFGYALDVDAEGDAYIAGHTRSTDFITTAGAYDAEFNAKQDGFIVKIDSATGALAYSTCFGGSSVDFIWDIAAGPDGSAYISGSTLSRDFPVTVGSFGPTYAGGQDAFVARLDPTGSTLVFGGFLGGTGFDRAYGIDVDGTGAAYVCGMTYSTDFPVTPGALDVAYGGAGDAFVTKVDPSGASLEYSTFLGGSAREEAMAIAVRPVSGRAAVTGYTQSRDFPVTAGAFDETHNGGDDAFVSWLDAAGASLEQSTYLGGSALDRSYGIGLGPNGSAYVGGETRSADFPADASALDGDLDGVRDGFVAKFEN